MTKELKEALDRELDAALESPQTILAVNRSEPAIDRPGRGRETGKTSRLVGSSG